jgi:hypothetical protein
MRKSSRPLKIGTNFASDGIITKKQDVLQEIGQQLLSSKHIFTLGQLMNLGPDENSTWFPKYFPVANQPILKVHLLM